MSFIELYPIPWGQEPPVHLRQIYEDAFPPEERRPWAQLFGLERCEHVAQLILSDDEVVGFVVGWELPRRTTSSTSSSIPSDEAKA